MVFFRLMKTWFTWALESGLGLANVTLEVVGVDVPGDGPVRGEVARGGREDARDGR